MATMECTHLMLGEERNTPYRHGPTCSGEHASEGTYTTTYAAMGALARVLTGAPSGWRGTKPSFGVVSANPSPAVTATRVCR